MKTITFYISIFIHAPSIFIHLNHLGRHHEHLQLGKALTDARPGVHKLPNRSKHKKVWLFVSTTKVRINQELTPFWFVIDQVSKKYCIQKVFKKLSKTLVLVQTGEMQRGQHCCKESCPASTALEQTGRAGQSGRRRWRSPSLRSQPLSHLGPGSLQAPSPSAKSRVTTEGNLCHLAAENCLKNLSLPTNAKGDWKQPLALHLHSSWNTGWFI